MEVASSVKRNREIALLNAVIFVTRCCSRKTVKQKITSTEVSKCSSRNGSPIKPSLEHVHLAFRASLSPVNTFNVQNGSSRVFYAVRTLLIVILAIPPLLIRCLLRTVGTQAYVSGSIGSKCLCCPYGYHIDLDFVRYCEAVVAGSADDRSSIERRKKRERRRQCQSMEVLLGLVIDRTIP